MAAKAQIPSLNGLRAVSILVVIASHYVLWHVDRGTMSVLLIGLNGDLGVRIFFVISGFLISHLLMEEGDRADLKAFYLRRILRLVPVQLVFIATLWVLTELTPLRISRCQFLSAVTYTKNYWCTSWTTGHLWSLSVEEQFYLVWPFVLVCLPRRWAVGVAAVLIAAAPLSRLVEGGAAPAWLTSHTDALMCGCLLAIFARAAPQRLAAIVSWKPWAGRLAAAALMLAPAVLNLYPPLRPLSMSLGLLAEALAIAYFVASVVFAPVGISYRLLNTPVMNWIGVLSYSLYIWQQILVAPPLVYHVATAWVLGFPQNMILLLAVAAASYYGLERPLMALRRRLRPKEKGEPEIQLAP